jgi:uncharacterized protein with FMN-binding domain
LPTAPSTTAGAFKDGTWTGATIAYAYPGGSASVQVTIVIAAGQITNASATYANSDITGTRLVALAVPKLNSETVAANSAAIATVAGASLTSTAYVSSLQDAIVQATA